MIPAANIANFFTFLSLIRPKSSLSKDCTGGEADAQSSDECTERGEIIHLFAVHYGVTGLIFAACLEANARRGESCVAPLALGISCDCWSRCWRTGHGC